MYICCSFSLYVEYSCICFVPAGARFFLSTNRYKYHLRRLKETHTCSEMSYRIVDVECIGRAKTTQLNLTGMTYIYIYNVTSQLRTTAPRDCHSSAQLRPPLKGLPSRATACRYVYTGPGGVSSLATDPPGTPVAPCRLEVLHLFRWSTHTPRRSRADEMKMKMKWRWKWDERYLTRTRRGERKRRGKEQTPTRLT